MAHFAVIVGGIVDNIIVGDDAFAASDHGLTLVRLPDPVSVGDSYDAASGAFGPPPVVTPVVISDEQVIATRAAVAGALAAAGLEVSDSKIAAAVKAALDEIKS